MTSQPEPEPGEGIGRPVSSGRCATSPRTPWSAPPAVLLLVAVIRLIPVRSESFASRTQDSFYSFVNLPIIRFPLGRCCSRCSSSRGTPRRS